MLNQRIHRDLETRRYRAADVFAAPGHVIERRRSAEINHDASCRVTVVGGDRIDDTVGPNLLGVLVQDGHPGLDPGPHHQGLAMEVAMRQVLERLIQRRYHAGDRDALKVERRGPSPAPPHGAQQHPPLVRSAGPGWLEGAMAETAI